MKNNEIPVFNGLVLVCDDNNMNLMLICEHLRQVGVKVTVAINGIEAVDMVRKRLHDSAGNTTGSEEKSTNKQFELIFMDIHMPVMNGIEASAIITQMDCNIPIVALTTDERFIDLQEYKEAGIVDYLGKPFQAKELWRCLEKHLKQEN